MRDVLDRTVREREPTGLQGLSQGFQDPPPNIMWLCRVSEVPGPAKCTTWLQGLHWGSMTHDKDVTLLSWVCRSSPDAKGMHQNCVFVCALV